MSKSVRHIIKRVAGSRLGQLLFILSLCFVLAELAPPLRSHPQFVGCTPTLDEAYTITEILVVRPVWVVAIGALYLPSVLLTSGLTKLLGNLLLLSCTPTARVEFAALLVCSSTQWWLTGYGIERLIRRKGA